MRKVRLHDSTAQVLAGSLGVRYPTMSHHLRTDPRAQGTHQATVLPTTPKSAKFRTYPFCPLTSALANAAVKTDA